MNTIKLVDLGAQTGTIREEINAAIRRVIDASSFIMGEEVIAFEREWAAFCGARYAVGMSSGSTALHATLLALGIGPGDEVITVPHTFIATAAAIAHVGARVVFVDIDPVSYTMDPSGLAEAVTERTRAVIPVHLYGQPAEMDPIIKIARENGITVIDDAAQAHGARYRGRHMGSLADATCFSFFPGKNLGAFGDAGAVTTDDAELAGKLAMIRNHGRETKYEYLIDGYNFRLDALQAAILRVKLAHLSSWVEARRRNARIYDELLEGVNVETPRETDYAEHAYHLYVVQSDDRNGLRDHCAKRGIATGIHYPIPLHLQPVFRGLGYGEGDFPVTERIASRICSLPMYPELTESQIRRVAQAIKEFTSKSAASGKEGKER